MEEKERNGGDGEEWRGLQGMEEMERMEEKEGMERMEGMERNGEE